MPPKNDRPAFSFLVRELEDGPRTYDETIPHAFVANALESEEELHAAGVDGALHVTLTKLAREVVIVGTASAKFTARCARCLQDAIFDVAGGFEVLAIPGPSAESAHTTTSKASRAGKSAGERGGTAARDDAPTRGGRKASRSSDDLDEDDDMSDDGPDTIRYDGEHLVLDEIVRDALLLEIPMMPLCSEACPGIERPPLAATEGDRPIDPRFAALLSVKPGS